MHVRSAVPFKANQLWLLLSEIGLPFAGLGYEIWSREFTDLRKEEEFLKWRPMEHPEWDDKN